jgi:hypothetical protein
MYTKSFLSFAPQGRGRKRAKFYNNRDGNLWPIDGSGEVSAKSTNLTSKPKNKKNPLVSL